MSEIINNEIINFINTNFTNLLQNNSIKSEVNYIINNLKKNICYIPFPELISYNINGIANDNNGIILSYLIPNLFRQCYINDSVNIPSICPSFVYINTTTHFIPLLIDEKLIKSFLYFNFPVNISVYNNNSNNNFLEKIIRLKYELLKKKKNTTYQSYTNSIVLYNEIYSYNSMLSQLISFNNYLTNTNYSVNNDITTNIFTVLWDFTNKCLCYDGILNDTYITGNNYYNTVIQNSYGNIIYLINNINFNADNIDLPIYKYFLKNNLITLLKYVSEVFQDILLQFKYFISGEEYCEKDYMNIEILPELLRLYKNYYNNQLYTYTKNLKSTSVANIRPTTISITIYFAKFDVVYLIENKDMFFIKAFFLNGSTGIDALSFYSNVKIWTLPLTITSPIIYSYFYLNTINPSAVNLENIWLESPDAYKTYEYVNDFVTDFNIYFEKNATGIIWNIVSKTFTNRGLYPAGGKKTYNASIYPNNQNIGYLNYYYHRTIDVNNPQYIIYLMLQSYSPYNYLTESNGQGVAALIYINYNN